MKITFTKLNLRNALVIGLISATTILSSCKDDDAATVDCIKCAGEEAMCVGDKDEDGATITQEDINLFKAIIEAAGAAGDDDFIDCQVTKK